MLANRVKIVVVGDGACGKTCLLIKFSKKEFRDAYVPTVFENYVSDRTIKDCPCQLALWDTAGQEDYDRLRPLSYPDTDVVLICVSPDSNDSYDNAKTKWTPEIRHFCPKAVKILVCCKSDLLNQEAIRSGDKTYLFSNEKLEELRDRLGASFTLVCSAKTGENVDNVFITAAESVLKQRQQKKSTIKCTIL